MVIVTSIDGYSIYTKNCNISLLDLFIVQQYRMHYNIS